MSTLSEVRAALAQTIRNGVDVTLQAYAYMEDVGDLPAILIEPGDIDYEIEFRRGMVMVPFSIFVLTPRNSDSGGQPLLDELIDWDGANSILRTLHEHSDLGLGDVDSTVLKVTGYGGRFQWYAQPHTGAIVKLRVFVSR
jgi:hypothetical protein